LFLVLKKIELFLRFHGNKARSWIALALPHAYATKKHAKVLYEPISPKIPSPPKNNKTSNLASRKETQ